jgi:ATP-dependent RNA helicase DDX5/DBP2
MLTETFGFKAPTPIQAQAWPLVMAGRDVVAVAVTGSGKTLGYLLPMFSLILACKTDASVSEVAVQEEFKKAGVTWAQAVPGGIVLAPTRELVQQIAVEALKLAERTGTRVCVVYGGGPKAEQAAALREGADLVVATPGRLVELLALGPPPASWRPCVATRLANVVTLDEADRMLDMGFDPQIQNILKQCPKNATTGNKLGATRRGQAGLFGRRQTLMFSATWPVEVQHLAHAFTDPRACTVIRITKQGTCSAHGQKLAANTNVTQRVRILENDDEKLFALFKVLREEAMIPGEQVWHPTSCFHFK